jgi:hypothetical protein
VAQVVRLIGQVGGDDEEVILQVAQHPVLEGIARRDSRPLLTLLDRAFASSWGDKALSALGEIARWAERNLRLLSTPDDHFAVILVSLFLAMTGLALLSPAWLIWMYLSAAVMLVYVPLGKIRHCIYFFFSRRFFGLFIGRRAVIHHPSSTPATAIREG